MSVRTAKADPTAMPKGKEPVAGVKGKEGAAGEGVATSARRHLRLGWWSLLFFLSLGILLEAFNGFKVQWYMAVANQTRRELWTLSHAHGTLLSLVNIAFGLTLRSGSALTSGSRTLASRCLLGATILLPAGFFLGGFVFYAGDPGLFILLVPIGALLLLAAILMIARRAN
jgi:hypothetical protein